jgi:hypothetical protein
MLTSLGSPLPAPLAFADGIAFLTITRADTARIIAVAKMRKLDPAHGDADQMFAFLADQFALGEKFAQVFTDPALDDLPETLVIFFDLQNHDYSNLVQTSDFTNTAANSMQAGDGLG